MPQVREGESESREEHFVQVHRPRVRIRRVKYGWLEGSDPRVVLVLQLLYWMWPSILWATTETVSRTFAVYSRRYC